MIYKFTCGKSYTRKDIFRIIGLLEYPEGGNWYTGYKNHEGDFFIFCNMGIPGRTGHDYNNHFLGDI